MYYEAGGLNVKALREENGEWRLPCSSGVGGVPGCAGLCLCACSGVLLQREQVKHAQIEVC